MNSTIKDIAQKLNISTSTVSRALNGNYGVHPKTMEKVMAAAREMNYVPNLGAKQLVGKGSNLIGFFIPEVNWEARPDGVISLLPHMNPALQEHGKDVLIFSVPPFSYVQGRLGEWIAMRGLEGCIFETYFTDEHPIVQDALDLDIPSINFSGALGPRCSFVQSDNYEGGVSGGKYLLEQGHRCIGYVNGPPHLSICKQRYAGFCAAFAEAGLHYETDLLENGDFTGTSGGHAAMELVLRRPDITAIMFASDLMAMGAIRTLQAAGRRIPEDISILGYDGKVFSAYSSPPLTTLMHQSSLIGTRAAEMLIDLLHGGTGKGEFVSPSLVVRESAACITK
ncbi:LacI family DNA-binding transcriptional regulator [Paenibacillus eucommiae]|uniref:LacI family transcriptional regulator n=1 Tax=Paenibacillus eucommiae TaxID=1355755 RepID=A0ABS4J6J9_9BACL|nr:LacI family DNA-binding transcriptional regulator [Paenibacillus eucommiae]MBP1995453.1 LacI family transcriptional regulator [Paenibacillus eucommiae]